MIRQSIAHPRQPPGPTCAPRQELHGATGWLPAVPRPPHCGITAGLKFTLVGVELHQMLTAQQKTRIIGAKLSLVPLALLVDFRARDPMTQLVELEVGVLQQAHRVRGRHGVPLSGI
jgi:hypothetical protein